MNGVNPPKLLRLARKARSWKPKFYPAIPHYMQPQIRDPFEYPLRTKEQILEQLDDVGDIQMRIETVRFNDTEKWKKDYNKTAKIFVQMDQLKLSELQKARLIQLLGMRYKNNNEIKLVVNVYEDSYQNVQKGIEQFHELYIEALRAPL